MRWQHFAIDHRPVGTPQVFHVNRVVAQRDATVGAADLAGCNLQIALGAATDQRDGEQFDLLDVGLVVKNLQSGLHDGLIFVRWRTDEKSVNAAGIIALGGRATQTKVPDTRGNFSPSASHAAQPPPMKSLVEISAK